MAANSKHVAIEKLGIALNDDPQDNDAWLNLGVELGEAATVVINGEDVGNTQCYVKCLDNDDFYWRAWYNLGIVMTSEDLVTVRGANYDRRACLVQCLELNDTPETAAAWLILGSTLTGRTGLAVKVRDDLVDEKQCYISALEQNPELAEAWHNLGLVSREREAVVAGNTFSMRQCFAKAITNSANYAKAWYSLALAIWEDRRDKSTADTEPVQGKNYNARESVLKSLQCDPSMACSWYLLSNILGTTGTADVNGKSYNAKTALLKALECDPNFAYAWCNVAPILQNATDGNTITVNGKAYNAQQCSIRSIELAKQAQQDNPYAWYNLGVSLQPGETATIGDQVYDAKACYATALAYDQKIGEAWINLGSLLGRDEKIQIVSTTYDKYACIARGEGLGVQWGEGAPTAPNLLPSGASPQSHIVAAADEL